MHRAGDTAVAPAPPGPLVTVIAAVLCCNHCHWAAVSRRLRGFIPKEFDFFLATFGTQPCPAQSPARRKRKDRSSLPLPLSGVVTSSVTPSGFYQHPDHSIGVGFLGNREIPGKGSSAKPPGSLGVESAAGA